MKPKRITGNKYAEDILKKYLSKPKTPKTEDQIEDQPKEEHQITRNLADFIKIPSTDILISKRELHKGKNWNDSHYTLQENGLYMPSPSLFIPYFLNVLEAAKGNIILKDGNNKDIPLTEAEDLWEYLSSNHQGGCYTHLDALFKEDKGLWHLETDHKVITSNKKKELKGTRIPLESCLREDLFVGLDFNSQGLPKLSSKSTRQEYRQGHNIYFWSPVDGKVARFSAGSDWAGLSCGRDHGDSDAGLGVFACASGA